MSADASTGLVIESAFAELLRVEGERDRYRELYITALGQLHDHTKTVWEQRKRIERLCEELRNLRSQVKPGMDATSTLADPAQDIPRNNLAAPATGECGKRYLESGNVIPFRKEGAA